MENTIEESSIYPSKPKCAAKKKDGGPCKNYARDNSVFCSSHRHMERKIEVKREKKKVVEEEVKVDEERLKKLNDAAMLILDHLMPEVKKEFLIAAQEWGVPDIAIYVLGLLNRLYKTVDFYNPDIEPEWQKRVVGYDDHLVCQHCNQVIQNPTHLRQKFCSNICARDFAKGAQDTGLVYPNDVDRGTEAEQDAIAAESERVRELGGA